MDRASYICLVRFQAFPFVPIELKCEPIRCLFEMDVQHPAFQRAVTPLLMNNQFTDFCRFLRRAKKYHWMKIPNDARDYELVEILFWEQEKEALANRILQTLLHFQHQSFPIVWDIAMNLLLRARTAEDAEATLCFMDAFAI